MTLEEAREWARIAATVTRVLNALEECAACARVTECEAVPYVDGYYCRQCIAAMTIVRAEDE